MDVKELKKIYGAENAPKGDKRDIFNCQNSVYLVNGIAVDILFIGSSNTERFEIYPYFNKYGTVVNRGIGGEATKSLLKRFDYDVLQLKPKVCVVQEGCNNTAELWRIEHAGKPITKEMVNAVLEEFESDMTEIIKRLKDNGIIPIIGTVFPIGVVDCRNAVILEENKIIKRLCEKEKVFCADYYSALVSEDGITLGDFSIGDDLHLHALGYNQVAKTLYPILDQIFSNE